MPFKSILLSAITVGTLLSTYSAVASNAISSVSASPVYGVLGDEGYAPPQGYYRAFNNPDNIALGKSTTVSGTIGGFPVIHNAVNITDGNYGNGRSWIDSGPTPWLTIDLASSQSFDTLSFGRDRLGYYVDRAPGQFTIAISNDNSLFTQIFDSAALGFSGFLSSGETIQASFDTVNARYVKLQLTNAGAGIDEVEIKLSNVPVPASIWLFASSILGFVLRTKKLSIRS